MNINDYSSIKNHLVSFGRRRLEQTGETFSDGTKSRKKTVHAWYELQDTCAYHEEFSKEKLVWIHLVDQGRFSYSEDEIYCNNAAYLMTGDAIKYLCVFLNSRLATWLMRISAPTSGMGVTQWGKHSVEQIPVPKIDSTSQAPFIGILDKILSLKENNNRIRLSKLESEINQLVYQLYNFTQDEIDSLEENK